MMRVRRHVYGCFYSSRLELHIIEQGHGANHFSLFPLTHLTNTTAMHHIEPVLGKYYDFDLLAPPFVAPALYKAIDTYQPTLSERLPVYDKSRYTIMLMHPGVPLPDDPYNRSHSVALLIIDILQLLKRALDRSHSQNINLHLFDLSSHEKEQFLGGVAFERQHYNDQEGVITPLPEMYHHEHHDHDQYFNQNQDIELGHRQLHVHVGASKANYKENSIFVIMGGILMFVACAFLALWFSTRLRRAHVIAQVTAAANAEKAALLVQSAKQTAQAERELNDYVAHEVSAVGVL